MGDLNDIEKYKTALNHIINCDRDEGHSHLSDAYRNDISDLYEVIKKYAEISSVINS